MVKSKKQDRQGVRTPADIERKYYLGNIPTPVNSAKIEMVVSQLSRTLSEFIANTNASLSAINERLSALLIFKEEVGEYVSLTDSAEASLDNLIMYGNSRKTASGIVSVGTTSDRIAIAFTSADDRMRTLNVKAPYNGLMGIPVPSGGNHTDASGQAWICDEIDFARGVLVRRIKVIDSWNDEYVGDYYISSTGDLTYGATVIYPNPDGVLEENLPEETIEAYKSIKLFYPQTDASTLDTIPFEFKLRYIADIKTYIDQKST